MTQVVDLGGRGRLIREARSVGATPKDIALHFDVGLRSVYRILAGWEPKRRKPWKQPARDARILRMFGVQPSLSLTTVGVRFGISRERVRQILAKEGKKPLASRHQLRKHSRLRRCKKEGCTRLCAPRKWYCPEHDSGLKPYVCQWCGETFWQMRNQVENAARIGKRRGLKRDGPFCSRKCLFSFFGKNYGWSSPNHPQQQKRRFWDAFFALMDNGQRVSVPWQGEANRSGYHTRAKNRGIHIRTKLIRQEDGDDTLQIWRKETG